MSDEQATPTDTVESTAVEIATDPDTPMQGPSAEIVPITSREVLRPLDSAALVESFAEYQALRGQLLVASDYQAAGGDKKFVKKSGWRKIATAFGLSVIRVSETVDRDDAGQPIRAKAIYRAIAPNGRSMDGDGYCSVDEERFSGPRGNKSKVENDLRATATTRAKNRAISDLVGMGEVSAEEVDAGPGKAAGVPEAGDKLKADARDAIRYLGGHNAKLLGDKILAASGGKLLAPVATALVYARAAHEALGTSSVSAVRVGEKDLLELVAALDAVGVEDGDQNVVYEWAAKSMTFDGYTDAMVQLADKDAGFEHAQGLVELAKAATAPQQAEAA